MLTIRLYFLYIIANGRRSGGTGHYHILVQTAMNPGIDFFKLRINASHDFEKKAGPERARGDLSIGAIIIIKRQHMTPFTYVIVEGCE